MKTQHDAPMVSTSKEIFGTRRLSTSPINELPAIPVKNILPLTEMRLLQADVHKPPFSSIPTGSSSSRPATLAHPKFTKPEEATLYYRHVVNEVP